MSAIAEIRPDVNVLHLQSKIGLGHATYWETVREALFFAYPDVSVQSLDVRRDSPFYARMVLEAFNTVYLAAGTDQRIQKAYVGLREHVGRDGDPGILLSSLNDSIRQWIGQAPQYIVADHAHVGIGIPRAVIEGDAIPEGVLKDPTAKALVPTQKAADALLALGKSPEDISVVGLVIPQILKESYARRLEKLADHGKSEPLQIGYFLTGQSPKVHVDLLTDLIRDTSKELNRSLHLSVYTGTNARLADRLYADAKWYAPVHSPTTVYREEAHGPGVSFYFGNTPEQAIQTSFALAGDMASVMTMLGERWTWIPYMHVIPLPPVNAKTIVNHRDLADRGLVLSPADTEQPHYLDGQLMKLIDPKDDEYLRLFQLAREQFVDTHLASGASHSAEIIYDASRGQIL